MKSLPKFRDSKCKWCPKIHSKGRCVRDCPNAASHIYRVSEDEKQVYKKWMDSVRASHAS
jgi:Fe-S-cluster-containing dehydrogenase component